MSRRGGEEEALLPADSDGGGAVGRGQTQSVETWPPLSRHGQLAPGRLLHTSRARPLTHTAHTTGEGPWG